MARRPDRRLSPEAAVLREISAIARDAARPIHLNAAEHARVVADLQQVATPYPHLLGREAGLLICSSKNKIEYEAAYYLRAAQILIDAAADLADVERWTKIGEERTHPNRST